MKKKSAVKKQHTVELTPAHVLAALDEVLSPMTEGEGSDGAILNVCLSDVLFQATGASKLVSTSVLNADKETFIKTMHEVQAKYILPLIKEWPHLTINQILSIEDESDDGLWIVVKVKLGGLSIKLNTPYTLLEA